VAGLVGQPSRANGRSLASGPWQSPGFGPPTCRLRQLALERSHRAQYRSDRLCPVVAGGLRRIRQGCGFLTAWSGCHRSLSVIIMSLADGIRSASPVAV